LKYRDPLWRS